MNREERRNSTGENNLPLFASARSFGFVEFDDSESSQSSRCSEEVDLIKEAFKHHSLSPGSTVTSVCEQELEQLQKKFNQNSSGGQLQSMQSAGKESVDTIKKDSVLVAPTPSVLTPSDADENDGKICFNHTACFRLKLQNALQAIYLLKQTVLRILAEREEEFRKLRQSFCFDEVDFRQDRSFSLVSKSFDELYEALNDVEKSGTASSLTKQSVGNRQSHDSPNPSCECPHERQRQEQDGEFQAGSETVETASLSNLPSFEKQQVLKYPLVISELAKFSSLEHLNNILPYIILFCCFTSPLTMHYKRFFLKAPH